MVLFIVKSATLLKKKEKKKSCVKLIIFNKVVACRYSWWNPVFYGGGCDDPATPVGVLVSAAVVSFLLQFRVVLSLAHETHLGPVWSL